MASVLLYLALSACATTAIGVYAGDEAWQTWEDWQAEYDGRCGGSSRASVDVGSIHVRGDSRGGCSYRSCDDDSDEGSRCDD